MFFNDQFHIIYHFWPLGVSVSPIPILKTHIYADCIIYNLNK
jgi:hypothetical protein